MSSRKFLIVAAFATLGLCFAQGASAGFPYSSTDPTVPPSTSPAHSGGLNNFGSDWFFAYSSIAPANVTVEWVPPDTAIIRGTAVGGEVSSGGTYIAGRQAVWDVNITVTGVVRTITPSTPDVTGPPYTQTVTYTGILTGLNPATVAGIYTLKPAETIAKFGSLPTQLVGEPAPNAPWVINVGAEDGVTTNLIVTSPPNLTFPAGDVLGVPVLDNQVFSFTETRTYTESPTLLPGANLAIDAGESVFQAVNRVLGLTGPNAFLSNAGLEPLLVEPDFIWKSTGSGTIALIGVSAGNTNTLGVYTDLGAGAARTPVDASTGFDIYPQPFAGKVIPIAAGQQFGWYLDSVGGSSNTFFSEPSLNTPLAAGDRRLRTYNLSTVTPQTVQVLLPGPVEVTVTPRFLLAWEDLVAGDNDFNDAMYIVADVAPVGSDADGPPALRYCHSKSLEPTDPPNCAVDGLNTTGAVASVAINSSCPGGTPGTGSISLEYPSNTAIITWQNLSCSSDNSGTEEIKPPHRTMEVLGTKIVISTEGGTLWVDPGRSGYSVNGTNPKDKRGQNQTIEGDEWLQVALVDSSQDKFLSFSTRFYVGKNNPSVPVTVTALAADGTTVGTVTRNLTGGADGLSDPQAFTSAEFGGNFAAVRFTALTGTGYGVFGGMFFTTVVP